MKLIYKKNEYYLFGLKLVLLSLLFLLMNFDRELNVDYGNYLANYENDWWQFEIGFELLTLPFKYFNIDFSYFWILLLLVESLLIALFYRNNRVFLLAFPNLVFLSQGLLGTQVRFAFAICLFLVLFSLLYRKKYFWLASLFPVLFHNSIIIVFFLSNSMKYFLNVKRKILLKKNLLWLFLIILSLVAISLLMDFILVQSGYYYYVGTKFQEGKSLSSLIYLFLSLFLLLFLLTRPVNRKYSEYIYLSFIIIVFSLIFAKSSVISGRFTLVYTLLEPFVLYYFYQSIGKKKLFFPFFILYCIFCYLKLFTITLKV